MLNLNLLDSKYRFLFIAASRMCPLNKDLSNNVTEFGKHDDAFILKMNSTPNDVSYNIKPSKKDGGIIIRNIVGYSDIMKIEKDFEYGILYFSALINETLKEVAKYIKNADDFELGTFIRPGTAEDIFKELENSTGIEVRYYLKYKEETNNEDSTYTKRN